MEIFKLETRGKMLKRIEAYNEIKPILPTLRDQVLEVCHRNNIIQICNLLNKPEKSISGRLSELERMGLIRQMDNNPNKYTIYLKANESERKELKKQWILKRIKQLEKTLIEYINEYENLKSNESI